jgi:hypothetical protein
MSAMLREPGHSIRAVQTSPIERRKRLGRENEKRVRGNFVSSKPRIVNLSIL